MKRSFMTLLAFEFSLVAGLSGTQVNHLRTQKFAPKITNVIKANTDGNKYSEEDIYKKTILISEDFNKFTAGAVDTPSVERLESAEGLIPNEFMQTPNWTGVEVYQAGGSAFIGYNVDSESTGSLNTPDLDISNTDLPVVVTLRAKCEKGDQDYVCVDILRDDNGEISYFTNDYATLKDEWTTFTFTYTKPREAGANYYIQFYGYYKPIYVDDIEVKFLEPYLNTPKSLPFTSFTLDGFTANWEAVEGAQEYLLSVFTLNDKQIQYVLEDKEVEGLSMKVEGLDTSVTYYYTVRAFDGKHYSPESEPQKVEGLIDPILEEAYVNDSNALCINWQEVPNASYYELLSFINHTADAAEVYTLSNELFDRINVGAEYTIYAPFADLPLEEELKDLADQPGWISSGAVRIDGAYGLDGYGYENYRKPVYLESPELDLSNNNGNFTINVDLLGVDQTRAVARVLHIEGNRMVVDDKFELNDLTEEWKNYTINLKNGTAKSYVEVCCYGPSYMYIDNLKISQNLNTGDELNVPFTATTIKDTTAATINVPESYYHDALTYQVRAVKEVWDEYGFSCDYIIYSNFATGSYDFKTITAIEDVVEAKPVVKNNNGQLTITNNNGEAVAIYNVGGMLVYQNVTGNKNISVNLPSKGTYIVKVGNKTVKVLR